MIVSMPYSNSKEDPPPGKNHLRSSPSPNWRLMLSILYRIMLIHILCLLTPLSKATSTVDFHLIQKPRIILSPLQHSKIINHHLGHFFSRCRSPHTSDAQIWVNHFFDNWWTDTLLVLQRGKPKNALLFKNTTKLQPKATDANYASSRLSWTALIAPKLQIFLHEPFDYIPWKHFFRYHRQY